MDDGRKASDDKDWQGLIEAARVGMARGCVEWVKPGAVIQAMKLLAAGDGYTRVAKEVGLSPQTLLKLKWRYYPDVLEAQGMMAREI